VKSETDAMKERPINVHQKLSYGAEKVTKPLLWLALVLLAIGLVDALVFDARRVPGEVLAFAGAIWAGFEFWRLHNPGDAMLVLSPAGLRLRIVGVKKVLIPWQDIRGVSSRDMTFTNPASTISSRHEVPNVALVEVSKRFYDRFIHVDSFLQRGPGWDNIFIQERDAVQIALHGEMLPVKSEVLRAEIEARWEVFRDQPQGKAPPRAKVTADGSAVDRVGWWALIGFSVAALAYMFVVRGGFLDAWERYERERRVEESARIVLETERQFKQMDEYWRNRERERVERAAKEEEARRNPPQPPEPPVESLGPARGHRSGITSLAGLPDGNSFLSASLDKTVKLWDLADPGKVRNVVVRPYPVMFVAVLPDGAHALSAGDEGAVVLSALADGTVVHVFGGRELGDVRAFAVTGDGRRAVSVHGRNGTGYIWDIAQRTLVKTLHMPGTRVLALSADGATAVTGSDDGSLWLWDLDKGSVLRTFEGGHGHKSGGVYAVAVMPDGTRAISGGADDVLRIWDLASGRELRTLSGHTDTVYSVAVSADGKRILSGSADATARLWDPDSGKEIVKYNARSRVREVAFAGGMVLTTGDNISISSWKTTGQLMKRFAEN
jgi:WD40 repeat protein